MFSTCANPDCKKEFDYREGRLFRFHKAHPAGEAPPNTHSVQHFWLCQDCLTEYTLDYHTDLGVLLLGQPIKKKKSETCCFVAAA